MRHRSVGERVERLSGASDQAAALIAEHSGGAELLVGVAEHCTQAADRWAAQAATGGAERKHRRAIWQPLERVGGGERGGGKHETSA